MKIAEVVATFPPYHGGMGYICHHNALELARRGHDVTVFTLDHRRLPYDKDPKEFKVHRLLTPLRVGDGGMTPQLLLRLKHFDLVHLHYPFFGGAEYVWLASKILGVPYFLTYHMDVVGNTRLKRWIMAAYEPMFQRRILRGAARLHAPGREYLRHTKVAAFVPWEKVTDVGYGGVDSEKYRPRPKDPSLVQKHGLQGKTVALFAGNLQPFKGLHLLIDALATLDLPDFVLLVVGGGYAEDQYRQQARERGVADRVHFAGPQSPDGLLPAYFNLGDFLVLPSTHSESFGLVVLEAMASGIPAIVSALPGPSQLVCEGVDGWIARVGDQGDLNERIRRMAEDGEGRRRMGSAARDKVVDRYRWERIGAQLEEVFREILDETRSCRRRNLPSV